MGLQVRDLMHQERKKESIECEKLVGKKFNASVLYAIKEWELSIYKFSTLDTKKCSNKPFPIELRLID